MKKNEKEVVLNLAEESSKLDHIDSFLGLKDNNEITGWSTDQSPFIIRAIPQVSPSRNLTKRQLSDPPILTNRISNPENSPKRRLYSRERKLPIIVQKVPKLHFVHAPFQVNLSKQKILEDSQLSLSAKLPKYSPTKVRKTFFPSDFMKYQSEDVVKVLKVRSIGKHYSSLE